MQSDNQNAAAAATRLWTQDFIVICVLNFLNFAGMWMLPSMLPVLIHDLGASDYMLGWIAGLSAMATIITRPLAGLAVVHFGRRGVFTVGTVGMVLTCLAFASVPVLGAVLVVRFIQGLFWGLTNTACATIASDIIPKPRFAEGMGYFGLASSLAMIVTPALSLVCFYTWGGSVAALVCAGFFTLALLCSCLVTYVKLPPYEKPQGKQRRGFGAFVRDELFERRALMAALLMMLTASSYGIVQSFLPSMAEERGIGDISLFFIVMAVSAIIARPAFGRWADRRSHFAPALTCFVAMATSMTLLAWAPDSLVLLGAAVLHGVGYSAGFSLFMALASVGVEPSRRGTSIATVMVGFDIGAGFSAIALGAAVELAGFEAAFFGGALLACVGVLVTLCFREQLSGQSGR